MGREQMFSVGRLMPVENPTPEPGRHQFVRASTIALVDKRVKHREFRVLCALEFYSWGDDRESWPTNRKLGQRAGGIGPEAVRQAIRKLEQLGYIRLHQDKDRWRGSRIELTFKFVEKIEHLETEE